MSRSVADQVQRYSPFGNLAPRRIVTIAAEQVHPIVRIAHRVCHPIDMAERILFDHELVFIRRGSGDLVLDGDRYTYGPGDLLFIQPFVPHSFQAASRESGEHIAIHFDFSPQLIDARSELADRAPYEVRLAHPLRIPVRQSLSPTSPIPESLENIVRLYDCLDPLSSLKRTRDMLTVLESAVSASSDDDSEIPLLETSDAPSAALQVKNQARIGRIIAYIHAHLARPLDAERLAEIADISTSRMNVLFRQATGYSPVEYVRRARVAEARRLLADLELSVKEIAARTGFEDSFHFSKVFRRIDGLSPTHYRDALVASRPR